MQYDHNCILMQCKEEVPPGSDYILEAKVLISNFSFSLAIDIMGI